MKYFKDELIGTIWIGTVIRTDDPLQLGRVKIKIFSKYDELEEDVIPWAIPYNQLSTGTCIIPKVGDVINTFFENGDDYVPFYFTTIRNSQELLAEYGEDYPKVWSLTYDKKLGEDGEGTLGEERTLEIFYTETQGLIIRKNLSYIQIKNEDESIFIKNGKTEDVIHINDDGISLGSEGISEEPAVLGDKNVLALKALSKQIDTLSTNILTFCGTQSTASGVVPLTAGLIPGYTTLIADVNLIKSNLASIGKKEIPNTRSSKVTLNGPPIE